MNMIVPFLLDYIYTIHVERYIAIFETLQTCLEEIAADGAT